MCNSSVLVNFAKEALAVDEMERSPPQRTKVQVHARKLIHLSIRHEADQFGLVEPTGVDKALADPVECSWSGHNKLHFRIVRYPPIVEIRDELVGKEIPGGWISTHQIKCTTHCLRFANALLQFVGKHHFKQPQMSSVFCGLAKFAASRGHDVGVGIYSLATCHRAREDAIVAIEPVIRMGEWAHLALEEFPRFHFVEELEKHRAKKQFFRIGRQISSVNDSSDKVLTDTICTRVGVC